MKSFPESDPQHGGSTVWKNELGELHREDGPAYEWSNGDKSYYQHGLRHREDGPAFEGWIGPNGDIPLRVYFYRGRRLDFVKNNKQLQSYIRMRAFD